MMCMITIAAWAAKAVLLRLSDDDKITKLSIDDNVTKVSALWMKDLLLQLLLHCCRPQGW